MLLHRRSMLEVIGLAGTTYFASALAGARRVRAASAAIPRRIVFFFTEQGSLKQLDDHGKIKPLWAPLAPGAPDPLEIKTPWSTSAFSLGDMHQALVPFHRQLLFLDGLDMISADVDTTPSQDAHTNGLTHALVGTNRQSSSMAGGISIDQLIAKGLNSPSPVTRLPSLEALIDAAQGGGASPLYAAAGQPIPIVGRAASIHARMFPSDAATATVADRATRATQLSQQRSVLDHAASDFSNLAGRLGKLDADRLSAHAAAIRSLESRLALGAKASCPVPDSSLMAMASSQGTAAAYTANADVIMRLIQTALSCDLTRVATICVKQAPNELFGYRASMSGTSDFHDLVHKTNGIAAPGKTVPPLGDDKQAMATVKAYHAYNASLFAKFLGLLQAIPESDGSTLLDHTVVVWCGDIAGGDHTLDRIPYVLAGGLGGTIKTGRYVVLPRRVNSNKWPARSDGIPHNNLFVSLASSMGVPTTTFGNPRVCTGALAHVLS
jgi:Protein of unknown function (DUF1552)